MLFFGTSEIEFIRGGVIGSPVDGSRKGDCAIKRITSSPSIVSPNEQY